MIKGLFNKKAQHAAPKPPVPVPDDAPPARYKWMSLDEAYEEMKAAVIAGDIGIAESIAYYHPQCHDWHVKVKMYIGGEQVVVPLVHFPAMDGNHAMLQWLIKRGANLEARDNLHTCTALYHAASRGHREAVETLLAAGADPAAQTHGHTPQTVAQAARANGHADLAELIEGKNAAVALPKTLRVERMHFREG